VNGNVGPVCVQLSALLGIQRAVRCWRDRLLDGVNATLH